jgi:subtilisin family serine protease
MSGLARRGTPLPLPPRRRGAYEWGRGGFGPGGARDESKGVVVERGYRSVAVGDLAGDVGPLDRAQPVLLELDAMHPGGRVEGTRAFFARWRAFTGAVGGSGGVRGRTRRDPDAVPPGLTYVTSRLYQAVLTRQQLHDLIADDRREPPPTIFKAWPDYTMTAHIDRSAATVKSDAARRTFAAAGRGIVWAVLDSGIDAAHPHFSGLGIAADAARAAGTQPSAGAASPAVAAPTRTAGLHRDFTGLVRVPPDPDAPVPGGPPADPADDPSAPFHDQDGHGTHVAGIIAGRCPPGAAPWVGTSDEPLDQPYVVRAPTNELAGMAPECELVSLKVLRLNGDTLVTSSAAVLRALDYIRTEVNVAPNLLRIHGINLSLGCAWDPSHYAAGASPLCQAIDQLAASGVIVVVSAGNGGQQLRANSADTIALMGSIEEPAHAAGCIAVGSTHREAPHRFGVTYTSSKGPTLDGRSKPDVVAPGEWITSAATGRMRTHAGLDAVAAEGKPAPDLTYAPDSGTSMAAPHVSGILAAFLSVRTEYVGRPDEVKELLLATATDLLRERYAQGHGLVDLMRMLGQS